MFPGGGDSGGVGAWLTCDSVLPMQVITWRLVGQVLVPLNVLHLSHRINSHDKLNLEIIPALDFLPPVRVKTGFLSSTPNDSHLNGKHIPL